LADRVAYGARTCAVCFRLLERTPDKHGRDFHHARVRGFEYELTLFHCPSRRQRPVERHAQVQRIPEVDRLDAGADAVVNERQQLVIYRVGHRDRGRVEQFAAIDNAIVVRVHDCAQKVPAWLQIAKRDSADRVGEGCIR
jgi:hypothetical protein